MENTKFSPYKALIRDPRIKRFKPQKKLATAQPLLVEIANKAGKKNKKNEYK